MVSGMRSASLPEGITTLEQGEAVVFAPGVGPVRLNIPRLEADDLAEVARMASAQRGNGDRLTISNTPDFAFRGPITRVLDVPAPPRISAGSDLVSDVPRAGARVRVGSNRADEIVSMFLGGHKVAAIAKALYPPPVGKERLTGGPWTAATDEITEVLREHMERNARPALTVMTESPKTEEEA
jgi:hypothetical protein